MIGQRTRLRENNDLPPYRASGMNKKPPFCYAYELIPCKIMLSKHAECNSTE